MRPDEKKILVCILFRKRYEKNLVYTSYIEKHPKGLNCFFFVCGPVEVALTTKTKDNEKKAFQCSDFNDFN